MALPTVAIVGRPNVGKSSLFNAISGKMISIVDPTAGVTRDRITSIIERNDEYIELVDTGGYGIVDSDALEDNVTSQIGQAMDKADLVIFMVDIRDGITPLDKRIAQLLRRTKLNVVLAANKADSSSMFPQAGEFVRLGFGDAICISAKNNMNKQVLLDEVYERLSHLESEKPDKAVMYISLVGKRNSGKSTFINALVGEDRVIVSEIPGTTRDAVDVRFEKDGRQIVAIDTAGIRKKNKLIKNDIEFYSYTRATKSVTRSDVVLFLIDATLPISQVDKKLAKFISEENKPCILVINKWDLAKEKDADTEDFEDYLTTVLPGLRYAPIAFTTAKDAKNIQSVIDLATELFKQSSLQLTTGRTNKIFQEIGKLSTNTGTTKKAGFPKIYYATQIATNPITMLLFVNRPVLFEENHQRFIINRLREISPFPEVPIKLIIRAKNKKRQEQAEKEMQE